MEKRIQNPETSQSEGLMGSTPAPTWRHEVKEQPTVSKCEESSWPLPTSHDCSIRHDEINQLNSNEALPHGDGGIATPPSSPGEYHEEILDRFMDHECPIQNPDDSRSSSTTGTGSLSMTPQNSEATYVSDETSLSLSHSSEEAVDPATARKLLQEKLNFIEITNVGKITRKKREDLQAFMVSKTTGRRSCDDSDMDEFMKASNYTKLQYLKKVADMDHELIPMCQNSCMMFYGAANERKESCDHCALKRPLTSSKIKNKYTAYYPLLPRFEEMLKNPSMRDLMKYRDDFTHRAKMRPSSINGKCYEDYFDGSDYLEMRTLGYFRRRHDVAIALPHDSFVFYSAKREGMTGVVAINLNLPPEVRVQMKHIMLVMLIPGPKKPKDLMSFLQRFIDEMVVLENIEKPLTIPRSSLRCKPSDLPSETTLNEDVGDTDDIKYNVFVVFACADGEAAPAPIEFFQGSNSQVPCRYCYIVGWPDVKRKRKNNKDKTREKEFENFEDLEIKKKGQGVEHIGHYCFPLLKPVDYPPMFEAKVRDSFKEKVLCVGNVLDDENLRNANDPRATNIYIPCLEDNLTSDTLPLRKSLDTEAAIMLVENEDGLLQTLKEKECAEKLMGIHGRSGLVQLTIARLYPIQSFTPIDMMHLMKNFGELMVNIWKKIPDTDGKPMIEEGMCKEITRAFTNDYVCPSGWGRVPMNVFVKPGSLKCIEWVYWIIHFSPIVLLKAFRNKVHYEGWMHFVHLCRGVLSRKMHQRDVDVELKKLVAMHTEYFKLHVYKGKLSRLHLNRYNSHMIIHVPETPPRKGPKWLQWNFPLERFFGILVPHIKSTSLPYSSVVTNYAIIMQLQMARMRHDLESLSDIRSHEICLNMQAKMHVGNNDPFQTRTGSANFVFKRSPLYIAGGEISRKNPGHIMYPRQKFKDIDMYQDFGLKVEAFAKLLATHIISEVLEPMHGEDSTTWPEEDEQSVREMRRADRAKARMIFSNMILYGKYRTPKTMLKCEEIHAKGDMLVKEYLLKHKFHTCGSLLQMRKDNLREKSMDSKVNLNSSVVAVRLEAETGENRLYYGQAQFYFCMHVSGQKHNFVLIRWTDNRAVPAMVNGVCFYEHQESKPLKQMKRLAKKNFAVLPVNSIIRPVALWHDKSNDRMYILDKDRNIPGLDLSLECAFDESLT